MKVIVFKKIISVILILFICFIPTAVISQEVDPTPTPTPTIEIAPTPTDFPPFYSESENSLTDTETLINGEPVSSDSSSINTGDNTNVISSDSANIDIKILTQNDSTVTRDTNVNSTTGGNSVSDNISINGPIELFTGDVVAAATITTILNTNVVGLNVQPIIHNLFSPLTNDFDLSNIGTCQPFSFDTAGDIQFNENTGNNVRLLSSEEVNKNVGVYNNNSATITNNVNLSSETGDNTAVDNIGIGVNVSTGNATSTADIANIANTNLVGNCGLFAVINVFDGGTGSIILPYEKGYLGVPNQTNTASSLINSGDTTSTNTQNVQNMLIDVTATNEASLSTNIFANTDTGNNSIIDAIGFGTLISIISGKNDAELNTIDMSNINLFDNNFLFLRVNHFGHFKGNLTGWDGEVFYGDDYFVLYSKIPTPNLSLPSDTDSLLINTGDEVISDNLSQYDSILDVENNNFASITNNITLDAQTGENSAGRFNTQITSGDATAKANVFNLANTNIVGNNWFVSIINIFDDFFGNIIFPRPDLVISKFVNTPTAKKGDQLTYSLTYGNTGQVTADHVSITDSLPDGVEVVSSSLNYTTHGNSLIFNVDDIVPNQRGIITIVIKVLEGAPDSLTNNATIATIMDEPNKSNNTSSVLTTINNQQIQTTQNDSPASSPTPTVSPERVIAIPLHTTAQFLPYTFLKPKTYHKEVTLTHNNARILGANNDKHTKGEILDGISTTFPTLFLTALIFYCLGVISGIAYSKRFS